MGPNQIKSTCSYCGVGCGVVVQKDAQNKITSLTGDEHHPVNRGMLCSKGRNLSYVVNDTSDRILYPTMKWSRNHPHTRVSWDEALNRAKMVFKTMIQKYGPESVGFYVSGQCLTEEYYLVNKLAKGYLGTNNVDTNSRLCMSSAVVGYKNTLGEDVVPISYEDIEIADCFLIAGANPAYCHPIIYRRIEQRKENHPDTKIIVVDPRKTDTAKAADLHLQILPGTDIILFAAIARILIEKGQIDHDFILDYTEQFMAYRDYVMQISINEAAKICQIDKYHIEQAARYIANAHGFITMWAMGLNQSEDGTDKNYALLNLSLLTGHIGKPGSGPFSLTGQPNAMGGREVGGMANLLAVHKDLNNEEHRQEVAQFWGVEKINSKPGYTATEMITALEKEELKVVWIICTNPLVSLPNLKRVEKALKKAKFVIVQDISHRSDTLQFADLILPAAGWLEKEGTMTNSERRITYLPKFIPPPGEARADMEILCDFAQRMGFRGFDFASAEEVYREYCKMTEHTNIDISHLSYDRLKNEGSFQWPVPSYRHPGTPRLFLDKKFYTPSTKAIFNIPKSIQFEQPLPNKEFPLILTTGRIRDQWHTMTRTGKVARLRNHYAQPVVEINPSDAYIHQIKDGDITTITSAYGEVRLRAKITDDCKLGVLFVPMHWGKQLEYDLNRANNLTSNRIDPQSKQPAFKYTLVDIEPYIKPKETIVLVGAGAAAFRFIQNYRHQNKTDDILVFSNEEFPFYNRVLLPEYITDELSWEQLQKLKKHELYKLKIQIYPQTSIVSIDKSKKVVTDGSGQVYSYDKLILATGSRSILPRNAQMDIPGRFKIRKKEDADLFKKYLSKTQLPANEQHVVIVGGGLLGLEMAAALNHSKLNITIVQRSSRLMERQLDITSSKLLAQNVQARGIQIYFDNEVSTVFNDENTENLLSITLKSGKTLQAHAIVYAIGTIPNIELAKNNGVACGRGIKVNAHLQTSDPHIFAIGEIAEFENELFGITAAAEEQASILAKYIEGDIHSQYRGSIPMNILKFEDLHLCSLGQINIPENDDSYEIITLTDLAKGYYKKCIVKDDLLIGAILMGDKNEFAEFKSLIENKVELSEKRTKLLRNSSNAIPLKGQLVCSCSQVGQGNLKDAIQQGCKNFEDLCAQTGAGLGCGSCKNEVRQILFNETALI